MIMHLTRLSRLEKKHTAWKRTVYNQRKGIKITQFAIQKPYILTEFA